MFRRFFRIGFGGCGCALNNSFTGEVKNLFRGVLDPYYVNLENFENGLSEEDSDILNMKMLLENLEQDLKVEYLEVLKDWTIDRHLVDWNESMTKAYAKKGWMSYEDEIVEEIVANVRKMQEKIRHIKAHGAVLLEGLSVDSVSTEEVIEAAREYIYNLHINETRELIVNKFGKSLIDSHGFNHHPELQLLCLAIKEVRDEVFKNIDKEIEKRGAGASMGYFFFVGFGGGTGTGVISPIAQKIGEGLRGYFALGVLSGREDKDYLKPQQPWFRRCFNTLLGLNDLLKTAELTGLILVDNDLIVERTKDNLNKLTSGQESEELRKKNAERIDEEIIRAILLAFGKTPFDDPNLEIDWSRLRDVVSGTPPTIFVPCYAHGTGTEKIGELIANAIEHGKFAECVLPHTEADKIFIFTRRIGDKAKVKKQLRIKQLGNENQIGFIEKNKHFSVEAGLEDEWEINESKSISDKLKKKFEENNFQLAEETKITKKTEGTWAITGNEETSYYIKENEPMDIVGLDKKYLKKGKVKKQLRKVFLDNKVLLSSDAEISMIDENIDENNWKITSSGESYILEYSDEQTKLYKRGKLEIYQIGGDVTEIFKNRTIVIETEEIGSEDGEENEVLVLLRYSAPESKHILPRARLKVAKNFVDVLDLLVNVLDRGSSVSEPLEGNYAKIRRIDQITSKYEQRAINMFTTILGPLKTPKIQIIQQDRKLLLIEDDKTHFILRRGNNLEIYSEKNDKINEILNQFIEDKADHDLKKVNGVLAKVLEEALIFLFPEDIPEEIETENYEHMKGIVNNLKVEAGYLFTLDDNSISDFSKFEDDLSRGTPPQVLKENLEESNIELPRDINIKQDKNKWKIKRGDKEIVIVKKIDEELYDIYRNTGEQPFLFERAIFNIKPGYVSRDVVMLTSILSSGYDAYKDFKDAMGDLNFNVLFRSTIAEMVKRLASDHPGYVTNNGGGSYNLSPEGESALPTGLQNLINKACVVVPIRSIDDAPALFNKMGRAFFVTARRKITPLTYPEIVALSVLYGMR